ncbi:MAG: hypothetical protein NC489_16305 [Ruminococcus flavefaciens]|nr:hypothetical protein [Ruminococcus flavefaciens]
MAAFLPLEEILAKAEDYDKELEKLQELLDKDIENGKSECWPEIRDTD